MWNLRFRSICRNGSHIGTHAGFGTRQISRLLHGSRLLQGSRDRDDQRPGFGLDHWCGCHDFGSRNLLVNRTTSNLLMNWTTLDLATRFGGRQRRRLQIVILERIRGDVREANLA